MVRKSSFLSYVNSLVGTATDQDGAFGAQCVDLILHVYVKYWNFFAWGNAIDFTRNNLPAGAIRGTKEDLGVQPGDILVWHFGETDAYGHIGICVEVHSDGTVTSVEQNIDGTPDLGGPARYKRRNLAACVAVIRPAFDTEAQILEKNAKQMEEEIMNGNVFFIKVEENLEVKGEAFVKGNIFLVNVGAEKIRLLNGDTYNMARELYPTIETKTATRSANYLDVACQLFGTKPSR